MKKTYHEKLKSPLWQKKRLSILERDEFHCQSCMDGENTLHVHHCYYEHGKEPWEYPDSSLITLCEQCHINETTDLKKSKDRLIEIMSKRGLLSYHYDEISDSLEKSNSPFLSNQAAISAFCWLIENRQMAEKIIDLFFEDIRSRK